MLVDLERNDLGRVCDYGTVRVTELMVNEFYSHVIHIVSNVRGHLHPARDAVDLVKAMFPGGTITGCPKVRCMEIVDELETVRRGPVHRLLRLDRRAAARPQHRHPHAGAHRRPPLPAGRRRHRRRLRAGARVPRDAAQGRRHAARRQREHRRARRLSSQAGAIDRRSRVNCRCAAGTVAIDRRSPVNCRCTEGTPAIDSAP